MQTKAGWPSQYAVSPCSPAPRVLAVLGRSRSCGRLNDIEHSHPPLLGELGLMGVEHVETGLMLLIRELKDAALRLALHDRVDGLQCRRERRAMVVIIEEVG